MSTVTLDNKTILVTGAAGFIGSNLVKRIYQEFLNGYNPAAIATFSAINTMLHKHPRQTMVLPPLSLLLSKDEPSDCLLILCAGF